MADIPAGTGLGSSGAFTVGALQALHAHKHEHRVERASSPSSRATIEIDRLGEPIGKQDQYIAAFGGITAFEFHPDDAVERDAPVELAPSTRHRLEDNLLLFYTGIRRGGVRRAGGRTADRRRRSAAVSTANLRRGEGARARDDGRARGAAISTGSASCSPSSGT